MCQIKLLISGLSMLILLSCSGPAVQIEEQNDLVEITAQQFVADTMVVGELTTKPFEKSVSCNGYLTASPNGIAVLSLPVSGIIKRIDVISGQQVARGQVLCEVAGSEIIDLQRDYAEAAAINRRLKSEYERMKVLNAEKISSAKDFIQVESEYKSSLAGFQALRLKLESVGLNALAAEEGEFQAFYYLRSPIGGQISRLNLSLGQYTGQNESIVEIVDNKQLMLKLSVFEKDIHQLKMGQQIQFSFIDNKTVSFSGRLHSIGSSIDPDTKSVFCYGILAGDETPVKVNNAFVESKIIVDTDTVLAAPEEALLKSDRDYFLLVMEKKDTDAYYFKKVQVKTGRQYKGFVEILTDQKIKDVLLKGAYNIQIE